MSNVSRETSRPLGLRRTRERSVLDCTSCGRETDKPRNGRCPRCAVRACRGAEVRESCAACGETDRRTLCLRQLAGDVAGRPRTVCGSCAVLLGRRTLTLNALRAERLVPVTEGSLLDELLDELGVERGAA